MSATCVVCGKTVAVTDRNEHLASNHLGPHYFWCDARKYRSKEPSMLVRDLRKLVGAPSGYRFVQDRNGDRPGIPDDIVEWTDSQAVDLTRSPHFFAIPPAAMHKGLPE